jgi:acetolactate synthase small subunit
MQPREKILAGVLATIVAVWFVRPMFKSIFIDPLADRNAKITRLNDDVSNLELRQLQLLQDTAQLAEWRDASLPPDVLAARREYPKWLYAMAELAGWEDVKVTQATENVRLQQANYSTVDSTIEAEATLDGINQFLSLMESAELLQRMSLLKIESPDIESNPVMAVTIKLEGVAVADASERSVLFPTTLLTDELSERGDRLAVASTDGFPQTTPFRVRVDKELLNVVSTEGTDWRVERGVNGTFTSAHDANDPVELLPESDAPADTYQQLVVDRLFVKPRPGYTGRPQFEELAAAVRGTTYSERLEVANWDPANGAPRFRLMSGAPDGLSLSSSTGELRWELDDDAALKTYYLKVAAYGGTSDDPLLQETLSLQVRRPNRAPHLSAPQAIDAWLGRPLSFVPQVEDADLPEERLTFSLSGDVPPDATFNKQTGEFRWTPPLTGDLGEQELELTVADSGTPPESDSATIVLNLRDDCAYYTKLVGTIVQGDRQEAWLYDQIEEDEGLRFLRLREGESFHVADIQGTVEEIRITSIDIRSNGALYELPVGKRLRDWRLIEEPAADETSDTAETSVVGEPE